MLLAGNLLTFSLLKSPLSIYNLPSSPSPSPLFTAAPPQENLPN